jgi:uncharacterized protein YyaL (SSP411 family)
MTQAQPRKDGTIRRAARVPDENARAAMFLAELGAVTGEQPWGAAMRRTVAAFERELEKAGLEAADWALAVQAALEPERVAPTAWLSAPAVQQTPSVMRFKSTKPGRRR